MFAVLAICATAADANVGTISFVNNTVPAGGFLLDGSAGFLTPDVPGNKIFAR
jgi:hypothetical protein